MEPIKGSPLFVGHRAFGSLKKYFFIFLVLLALAIYLEIYYPVILHYVLFTYHGIHITVLDALLFLMFLDIVILAIRHYQITYIITTRQVYVKLGIIASNARSYLYDQVQEASSFQTIGQRIFLWGQLNVTMLITMTGQSKVEEAHLDYIHRPKHIANLMMSTVNVGKN
jgi:uncharacterized membrane protein YdbT with pleckstrin-like domain